MLSFGLFGLCYNYHYQTLYSVAGTFSNVLPILIIYTSRTWHVYSITICVYMRKQSCLTPFHSHTASHQWGQFMGVKSMLETTTAVSKTSAGVRVTHWAVLKHAVLNPNPRVSDSIGLGQESRICLSDTFPGGVAATDVQNTLGDPLPYRMLPLWLNVSHIPLKGDTEDSLRDWN